MTPNDQSPSKVALSKMDDIAQHGLQTSQQVIEFLKSKSGETLIAQLNSFLAEKKKELDSLIQEYIEQQNKLYEVRAAQEKKEEEEKDNRLQQNDTPAFTQLSPLKPISPSTTSPTIANLPVELETLNTKLQEAEQKIEKKEKLYQNYEKNINEVDKFITEIEQHPPEHKLSALEKKIAELEGTEEERNRETDEILALIDEGLDLENKGQLDEAKKKINEGRDRLDAQNAKNLQIGTLKDMVSVIKGEKKMYDKTGKPVTSFNDADFIVPKDKKLVIDNGESYLLKENEELNDNNRSKAKADFERAKPEMSSVKNLVRSNKEIEMGQLALEVHKIGQEINELQEKLIKPTPPIAMSSIPAVGLHSIPNGTQQPSMSQIPGKTSGSKNDTQTDPKLGN